MNLKTWYDSGSATVLSGSTIVTGTGALWGAGGTDDNIMVGDLFSVPSQPMVPAIPIASVTEGGDLELLWPWPGADVVGQPYIIRYVGIIERSTRANRMALERMGEISAWYDVIVETDADRLALETAGSPLRAGYRVLVKSDGVIWAKETSAYGDWIGPVEFKGDTGEKGDTGDRGPIGVNWRGAYNPAMPYAANDGVLQNGSSWRAKESTTGNEPPALPATENTQWVLIARAGVDGTIDGVTPFWVSRLGTDMTKEAARAGLGAGVVNALVPGAGIAVDNTDPTAPVVSLRDMATPIQGRLSLTSGIAVTTTDVAGATSVHYVPVAGQFVRVFDGASFVALSVAAGLTLALDSNSGHTGYHQAGKNFPLFVVDDGGIVRLCSGPAWTTDVVRGSGSGSGEIEVYQGLMVNKHSISLRFGPLSGDMITVAARRATWVGDFRATSDGQAEDSASKRFLFNAYNRVPRKLMRLETTNSWIYSTPVFRQARGSALNQVEVLRGLDTDTVRCTVLAQMQNSTSTPAIAIVAIGLDSTTAKAADSINVTNFATAATYAAVQAIYCGNPGVGLHRFTWLERGAGSDAQTWLGNAGLPDLIQLGMMGECWA